MKREEIETIFVSISVTLMILMFLQLLLQISLEVLWKSAPWLNYYVPIIVLYNFAQIFPFMLIFIFPMEKRVRTKLLEKRDDKQ